MAINKYWEDDFDENDYDDLKEAHVERERLRQENSNVGWIYIGLDTRNDREAKIGRTIGTPGSRAGGTQNRYYALLCAFKIRDGVHPSTIELIEGAVHEMIERDYERMRHPRTGRKTEWFSINSFFAKQIVHDFLYEKFNQYMHCYHCHERDKGVIYSWEPPIDSGRVRYQATDLSNPPVAYECSMPPGCGADCDCWG